MTRFIYVCLFFASLVLTTSLSHASNIDGKRKQCQEEISKIKLSHTEQLAFEVLKHEFAGLNMAQDRVKAEELSSNGGDVSKAEAAANEVTIAQMKFMHFHHIPKMNSISKAYVSEVSHFFNICEKTCEGLPIEKIKGAAPFSCNGLRRSTPNGLNKLLEADFLAAVEKKEDGKTDAKEDDKKEATAQIDETMFDGETDAEAANPVIDNRATITEFDDSYYKPANSAVSTNIGI